METLQETPLRVDKKPVIEVRVDPETLKEKLEIWEWIALQSMNFVVIRDVVARFVINPDTGEYFENKYEAYKIVNRMTLGQLEQNASAITQFIRGLAVPKV